MESVNSSFSGLLTQIRSCSSKWEEIRKERDILKSSLQKANDKIAELETTVARYKAKDLVVERERLLLSRVINTLHEELVKEGPISKKIDEIEEDVSWLSKAVEKSISDLDKRKSSIDSNNSCCKVYENETQVINGEDALIKNHKNKEQSGIDDVDLCPLHVTDKNVEFPSACSYDRSKPSILQQTLTQPVLNEGVNLLEFTNLFTFYSTLFSISENSQSKIVPTNNGTLEKNDCRLFLTDLIASSSQRFANRNDSHNKSYSFSKNEIPSCVVTPSSNFSLPNDEVVRNSETITSNQDKCDSSLSGQNKCNEVVSSNDEDIGIENPDDQENPPQIGTTSTSIEFTSSDDTAEEILRHQISSDSSPLSNNEYGDVENSNEDLAIQNSDNLQNPSEISSFNEVTENDADVEMAEEDLVTESGKNSNYYCNEINEMSCVEIPNWRYNLRERKFIKNDKYSSEDEYFPSNYSNKKTNSSTSSECKKGEQCMKNENYLSVHGSIDPFHPIDSCSASEGPSPVPLLNSRMCIPDKTISKQYRKKCLICAKQNPNDSNPQFFSYRELDQHLLENHPNPFPVYTRCPYEEKNCIRHFRSRTNLRTHILLHQKGTSLHSQKNVVQQQKSWLCTFCGEMFALSVDLKNHVKREHSAFAKASMTCEYCKYVTKSSKKMKTHKLKYHTKLTCEFGIGHPAKNINQEDANEKSDEKGEISSSHMVSSSNNRKKISCMECVICRRNNPDGMKFQSSRDLDSHISKYHPNPFPDYYPCPRRSDCCNRHFTSIRSLSNHLRGCPPKIKAHR